ncbi:hypothetical protein LTR53_006910 [Teratosphaeriaceae sp. CCFEE 6253]|nr:hypothetical protein LTR53_006910 [Teratosphaeriaceae sp. CCFEE 6253]
MLANERKEPTDLRTTLARHNDCDDAVRSLRDENAVLTARCAGFVRAEAEASRAKTIERARAAQLEAELVYHGDCWDRESKLRAQAEIDIARVNVLTKQLEEATAEVLDLQRAEVERAAAQRRPRTRTSSSLCAPRRSSKLPRAGGWSPIVGGSSERWSGRRRREQSSGRQMRCSEHLGPADPGDERKVTRRSASLSHGNKNAVSSAIRQEFAKRVEVVIECASSSGRRDPSCVHMGTVFAALFDDLFDALAIDDSIDFRDVLDSDGNGLVGSRCIRKRLTHDPENAEMTPMVDNYACADCVGLGLPCFMQVKTRFEMLPLHPDDCFGHTIQGPRDHGH